MLNTATTFLALLQEDDMDIKSIAIDKLELLVDNNWGLGIGDWGLGIGDWGLGPIPNPQSPIPNPQFCIYPLLILKFLNIQGTLFFENLNI